MKGAMQRIFRILLIVFFFQLTTHTICNGENPQTPEKAIQKSQFITSDEVKALVKQEIVENQAKMREKYDKQLLEFADLKLQFSETYLKIAQAILSSLAWIAGILGFLFAAFIFFGAKIARKWFEDTLRKEITTLRETADKEIKDVKKSLEKEIEDILTKANSGLQKCDKANQEILIGNAKFHTRMGFLQWQLARVVLEQKQSLIKDAIRDTELALELNPPDEELRAQIESNLGYYYAEIGVPEKKDAALKHAAEARDLVSKYPDKALYWLPNYGYVLMRYAATIEELNKATDYLKEIKEKYPDLRKEVDIYLEEAEQKRQIFISEKN